MEIMFNPQFTARQTEAFDFLDAPIKRVCAPNTPIPFSPVLERFWMPDEENLIKAITELLWSVCRQQRVDRGRWILVCLRTFSPACLVRRKTLALYFFQLRKPHSWVYLDRLLYSLRIHTLFFLGNILFLQGIRFSFRPMQIWLSDLTQPSMTGLHCSALHGLASVSLSFRLRCLRG